MALQFDMSKGSWKQDYLMQLQGNEGISPYRQAGADLGTALGAVGSALLPERGKNIAANFNKMSSDFKKASSSRQSAIKAAIKKDREKGAGYFQGKQKPDLTALQGLGAMGGTALGVAGLATNPLATIATAAGMGAIKNRDKIKNFIKDNPDAFKVSDDGFSPEVNFFKNPLMKAIKKPFQKRKSNQLLKQARTNPNYYGEMPEDELDLSFSESPIEDDYTLLLDELAKRNMKPTLGNLKKARDNKLPPIYDDGISRDTPFQIPEGHPGYYQNPAINSRLQDAMQPSRLYSPKESAARDALLNQNFGPLQSILMQESIGAEQRGTEKPASVIHAENILRNEMNMKKDLFLNKNQYVDPILDTTNMLQGVDTTNVKPLSGPNFSPLNSYFQQQQGNR